MELRVIVIVALCSIRFLSASAQGELFEQAFTEFSTARLWKFEEIDIDWKMKGNLQAELNEGLNNLLEDNPKLAIESFNTVLKEDPTIWQAYYYRSAAQKQLKKLWHSKEDIDQALKLRGDFYEGLVELAKILHLQRESIESERIINKAIRMDPSRGGAYYVKGDINILQDQIRNAIGNFRDCLSADSLYHDARLKIALLEARARRKLDEALGHIDKVLSYDSLQKSALLFRSVLNLVKDKQQSVKDLSTLIKVDPDNLLALYLRGLTLAELEQYPRAFNDFNKLIKSTSIDDNNFVGQQSWLDKKIDIQNAGAYVISRVYGLSDEDGRKIKEAYCLLLLEKHDQCLSVLDGVSVGLNEPMVIYLKGIAHEHKGEHNKAFEYYDQAIALDGSNADALKKRGIYLQELQLWGESVRDFTTVLKLYPEAFFINRLRGVSYYHLGSFSNSVEDFNVYLKNDSTNEEVRSYRGMGYLKVKQRLKAYVDFAVSDNSNLINFRDAEHLIDSILQKKDTTLALHYLDVITENVGYFTEGFVLKFKIHQSRGEWEPIKKDITKAIRNSRVDADKSRHSYLLTLQAIEFSKHNHLEDALKALSEAIKYDDKNDVAYLERGRLFASMGKSSKAQEDFKKASVLGNAQAKLMVK